MRRWLGTAFAALCVSVASPALADDPAGPPAGEDLSNLTIEQLANIKVLSVAPLLADAIKRIHFNESVSKLFE